MHKHICLNCSKVIAEGSFDCGIDADHDFALCDDCATHSDPAPVLADLLAQCRARWRQQGWEGDDSEFEYTVADLEWVCEEFGRKPTAAEWAEAGLRGVGSYHVQRDSERGSNGD